MIVSWFCHDFFMIFFDFLISLSICSKASKPPGLEVSGLEASSCLGGNREAKSILENIRKSMNIYGRNPNERSGSRGRHGMNCLKFTKSPENTMAHGSPNDDLCVKKSSKWRLLHEQIIKMTTFEWKSNQNYDFCMKQSPKCRILREKVANMMTFA